MKQLINYKNPKQYTQTRLESSIYDNQWIKKTKERVVELNGTDEQILDEVPYMEQGSGQLQHKYTEKSTSQSTQHIYIIFQKVVNKIYHCIIFEIQDDFRYKLSHGINNGRRDG